MDDGRTALTGALLVTDSPPAKAPGHVVYRGLTKLRKEGKITRTAPQSLSRERKKNSAVQFRVTNVQQTLSQKRQDHAIQGTSAMA